MLRKCYARPNEWKCAAAHGAIYTESMNANSVDPLVIGKRIRAARERLGWSQTELAQRAGSVASYQSRLEAGQFERPSVERLSAIARAITAAGLPPITVKDLRATAATVLLDQGVPLPRVSELLGHADVATTARFYARVIRLTADRVADVAEGMDAAFARAAGAEKPAEIRKLAEDSP